MEQIQLEQVKAMPVNTIPVLEKNYPLHDRRHEGFILTGFDKKAKPTNRMHYPYGKVPMWRFIGWEMKSKYTGAKLRELRKQRGVGKVKNAAIAKNMNDQHDAWYEKKFGAKT